MGARLEAIAGQLQGATFQLTQEVFLDDSEGDGLKVLGLATASPKCVIRKEAKGFRLSKGAGVNGLTVNGLPMDERMLEDGDKIALGDSVFLFRQLHLMSVSEASAAELAEPAPCGLQILKIPEAMAELSKAAQNGNSLLVKACRTLSSVKDFNELERQLLDFLSDIIPAERGAILLRGDRPDEIAMLTGWDKGTNAERSVEDSREVIERVLRDDVAVLRNDPPEDSQAPQTTASSRISSLLAVPLEVFGKVQGAIYMDTCDPGVRFTVEQLRLLVAFGGLAALALDNARRLRLLEEENRRLEAETGIEHDMVGDGARMKEVYRFIGKVGPMDATSLIFGESGTGKELAARALHTNSPRASKPFVAINCAALPETLLESELFGYEKGAFTGAVGQKKGLFEAGEGGTVFLDEIGEISLLLQPKLLRVLQQREVLRLGGTQPIPVNVRLIAETNRDLADAVRAKTFRQDLYYRLNVVSLMLPPLRERREDIETLANHFLKKFAANADRQITGISPEARTCMQAYDWPGNVRELENAIERAVVLGTGELLRPEDLPEPLLEKAGSLPASGNLSKYHDAIAEAKRQLIVKALQESGGNYTRAAKSLGLQPTYLHRLIRNLNLKPTDAA